MLFEAIFMFLLICRFLIWQLLCGWWVTTADQFHPSVCTCTVDSSIGTVCYYPDEEIDQDVTCWMTANICSSFLQLELYSPFASSIGKWSLITGVLDHVKSGSWCGLSKAHNWYGETPGGREIGMGREWGGNGEGMGRGRSVYEQPGAKLDGIAPHKRRDSK